MHNTTAIILCGGKGSRMGSLSENMPKAMIPIHGKPIIWYAVKRLLASEIHKMVFPKGYKGDAIQKFLEDSFPKNLKNFQIIETGEQTEIKDRIAKVMACAELEETLLMINGDTIFDVDLKNMADIHKKSNADLTMWTVPVQSQFGAVVCSQGKAMDFVRHSTVHGYKISVDGEEMEARIFSGFSAITAKRLREWIASCGNAPFEQSFYGETLRSGGGQNFHSEGFWMCFDTPKDVERAHNGLAPQLLDLQKRLAMHERVL